MTTNNTSMTFWMRWKRGFSVLWWAGFTIFFPYFILLLPVWVGMTALEYVGEPWRDVLRIAILLVWFPALLILFPVMVFWIQTVYRLQMDPISIKEELASQLEPKIDALATHLGVRWEDHYFSHVCELLENGESTEARRYYHDHSGATWGQVDQALSNWRTTVVTDKLTILQKETLDEKQTPDDHHTT